MPCWADAMKVGVSPLRIISAMVLRKMQKEMVIRSLYEGRICRTHSPVDVACRSFVAALLSMCCAYNLYAYNQKVV